MKDMMRKAAGQLRNLKLFAAAILSGLARRTPERTQPKRILLVPAGKLGDIVCTTPVLRALRSHFPLARVYVAEYGIAAPLLADSALADSFLDATDAHAYVTALRRERIDTVFITGPSLYDLATALIARVPRVVAPRVIGGHCPQQTRTYRALLHFVETYPYAMRAYAPRERLRALEPFGIHTDDTTKRLGFSGVARAARDSFLSSHMLSVGSYAVVSPGAGNKIKEWPPDRFARVAEHIARKGFPVVVIGTVRDKKEVTAMIESLSDTTDIINTAERFSLDELKALIAGASLFVSVDTGPLYIAEAFGIPTIDITGPIDEKEQPPIGPKNRVVIPPERGAPELFVLNARSYDQKEALRHVHSISVEMVTREIDALIEHV